MNFSEKAERSREIIMSTVEKYNSEKLGVLFTGGKDSIVTLHLIRQMFGGNVPFKVIWIDTSVKFPENKAFVEKMKKLWQLKLYTFKNEDALKDIQIAHNRDLCCKHLKTEPLMMAVRALGLKALITGERQDEDHNRYAETNLSEWPESLHIKINPIKHFSAEDVWNYIENYHVPYCSLYQKGYGSLDCMPCAGTVDSMNVNESLAVSEDRDDIKRKLKSLGYL